MHPPWSWPPGRLAHDSSSRKAQWWGTGSDLHNKLWKILKEMGIPDRLTCLLKNLYEGQETTLQLNMEQQTDSRSEYVRAVYCTLLI